MSLGLNRDSRSRRMLILRQAEGEQPTVVEKPKPQAVENGGGLLTVVAKLLKSSGNVTWVFTGEDAGRAHPEKTTLSSLFEAEVREACGRVDDVIVDTTKPGDRLVQLWQDVRTRVLRFEPRVVFVQFGPGDPRNERIRHETAAIGRTLEALRAKNAIPVLITPTAYAKGDEVVLARQCRRVELVARHLKLPFIDVRECRRPSDAARILLKSLGLNVESDVAPVEPADRAIEPAAETTVDLPVPVELEAVTE